MADNRQFAKIDHGYFDNPKVGPLVDDNLRAVAFHMRARNNLVHTVERTQERGLATPRRADHAV